MNMLYRMLADPLGAQALAPHLQPLLNSMADLQQNMQQNMQQVQENMQQNMQQLQIALQQQMTGFQQQTTARLEALSKQITTTSHNAHARIMNSKVTRSEHHLVPLHNEVPYTVVSLLSCRPAGAHW